MNYSKSLSNIAEERLVRVGITGTGAADPTRRAGPGVTVSRTSEGVLKFSFNENPGTFVGVAGFAFRADTPSDVAGYTIAGDTYVAPSGSTDGYIELTVVNASDAADDLEALEYLDVTFVFAAQSVID